MKQTNRIKRLLVTLLAGAMLVSVLWIPSFAANEKVIYTLESSAQSPEIGTIFSVTLKLRATRTEGNFNIPYLRFNLHYNAAFFEPLGYNGQGQVLSKTDTQSGQPSYERFNGMAVPANAEASGHFAVQDFTGDVKKYPTSGAEGLNVLAVQWIAPVTGGAVQTMNVEAAGDGGKGTALFRINFRVKESAPLDGTSGLIAIFKNYTVEDMPFYMQLLPDPTKNKSTDYYDYTPTENIINTPQFPVDVTGALLSLKPSPHSPTLEVKAGAPVVLKEFNAAQKTKYGYSGIIYGFPESMTQQGTTTGWIDPQYAAAGQPNAEWLYASQIDGYLKTTNLGVLHVSNNGKPEHKWDYGTGTNLSLYSANKTQVVAKYYFVVFGDVDGNFIINLDDYTELKAMLNGLRGTGSTYIKLPGTSPSNKTSSNDPYDTPYHLAAHVANTSSAIPLSNADLQKVYNVALGLDTIGTQKPTLPPLSS